MPKVQSTPQSHGPCEASPEHHPAQLCNYTQLKDTSKNSFLLRAPAPTMSKSASRMVCRTPKIVIMNKTKTQVRQTETIIWTCVLNRPTPEEEQGQWQKTLQHYLRGP